MREAHETDIIIYNPKSPQTISIYIIYMDFVPCNLNSPTIRVANTPEKKYILRQDSCFGYPTHHGCKLPNSVGCFCLGFPSFPNNPYKISNDKIISQNNGLQNFKHMPSKTPLTSILPWAHVPVHRKPCQHPPVRAPAAGRLCLWERQGHVSSVQNPCWLDDFSTQYIGDYTDYSSPYRVIPINQPEW